VQSQVQTRNTKSQGVQHIDAQDEKSENAQSYDTQPPDTQPKDAQPQVVLSAWCSSLAIIWCASANPRQPKRRSAQLQDTQSPAQDEKQRDDQDGRLQDKDLLKSHRQTNHQIPSRVQDEQPAPQQQSQQLKSQNGEGEQIIVDIDIKEREARQSVMSDIEVEEIQIPPYDMEKNGTPEQMQKRRNSGKPLGTQILSDAVQENIIHSIWVQSHIKSVKKYNTQIWVTQLC
jgi:hypothetical protein